MATTPGSASRTLVVLALLALLAAAIAIVILASPGDAGPGTRPADGERASAPLAAPTPAVAAPNDASRGSAAEPGRAAVDVAPAATPSAPELEPAPAPGSGVEVTGRVVDARGLGIAGAEVGHTRPAAGTALIAAVPRELRTGAGATTAADGTFRLLAPPGPAALVATHELHPPAELACEVPAAGLRDLRIEMADGGTIEGRVTGAPESPGALTVVARRIETGVAAVAEAARPTLFDFGTLLETLQVPLGGRTGAVGEDLAFTLRGLEHGARYRVHACRTVPGTGTVRCTEVVEASTGVAGIELPWRASFALVLRVVDDETGQPLEELDVEVGPVARMRVAGVAVPVPARAPIAQRHFPGGAVELDGLGVDRGDGATLSVQVAARGRRAWSRDDVASGRPGRVDLGVVRLAAAPIVRVSVTAAGAPVANAQLTLEQVAGDEGAGSRSIGVTTSVRGDGANGPPRGRPLGTAHTGADGVAEVTAPFAGRARVRVAADALAPARGAPFELPTRGVVEQAMALVAGGTAVVTVVDGRGAPLAGASVTRRCELEHAEGAPQRTDAAGVATFRHLVAGEHRFDLRTTGDGEPGGLRVRVEGAVAPSQSARTVTIGDRERVEVRLQEPLRGTLHGMVTLDGRPLADADVRVDPRAADEPSTLDAAAAEMGAAMESLVGGLLGSGKPLRTDDAGRFEAARVPVGPLRVRIVHDDLAMPALVDVELAEGDNHHTFALRATTVRGRVLGDDGEGLGGALVGAEPHVPDADVARRLAEARQVLGDVFGGARDAERTDDDGSFVLRGVRPGTPLRVQASARQHATASVVVPALAEGATADGVTIRLRAAGRVRVRAAADGAFGVKAHWAGDPAATPDSGPHTALLQSGRAALEGLPAGRWRLVLDGTGAAKGQERIVDVTVGGTTTVEF